jgi:hypothetical protein
VEQKVALKHTHTHTQKKLRTQINGKCNDRSSADEKNITVKSLFKKERQYMYSSIEDSEVLLVSEHNNAGLKKL